MNQFWSQLGGALLSGIIVGVSWGLVFNPFVGIIAGIVTFGLSLLISAFAPKTNYKPPKPYTLDDFETPTVKRDSYISRVYGDNIVTVHYVWYGNLVTEKVEEDVDVGKGAGGDSSIIVGYKYYCDVFLLCCEEPVQILKGPLNQDLLDNSYESITFLNYEQNKVNIFNSLSQDIKEKAFVWKPFFTCFIKQCYLGENVNRFPALYFLVRDKTFAIQPNDTLRNKSYIKLPVGDENNLVSHVYAINPISVLLSLFSEFFYKNKTYCSLLLESPIIDKKRWESFIHEFSKKLLGINTIISTDIKIKDFIEKILFVCGLKIDTLESNEFPFKLTLINISSEKDLNNFDYPENDYNKINESNIIDDFNNFSIEYNQNEKVSEIIVSTRYSINKKTEISYQLNNNQIFENIQRFDFSEFYYTDYLNFILSLRFKNLYLGKTIKCSIPIHKLNKITSASLINIKYEPIKLIGKYQVEEIEITNDYQVNLTLKEIII